MRRSRITRFALAATLCLSLGGLSVPPAATTQTSAPNVSVAAAPAVAATTQGCLPDVGKKVPVLFVHGLNAGPKVWGDVDSSGSFIGQINKLPNAQASKFDYEQYSLQWVTNPNIGPRLADQIACMATSSRQQGGPGKIVVVAHSMGGLATREAIKEQPQILQDIGMVFTIATPNTGSSFDRDAFGQAWTLCHAAITSVVTPVCEASLLALQKVLTALPALQAGSQELKELPMWPRSLPVYAIAGNIAPHYNLFGWEFDGPPSNTDTLVTTQSALHGVIVKGLGGAKVFSCVGGPPPIVMGWTKADCEHGALINNSAVQAEVVKQIKAYLAKTASSQTSAAPSGSCPVTSDFVAAAKSLAGQSRIVISKTRVTSSITCQQGWAVATVVSHIAGGGDTNGDAIVLRLHGGQWTTYTTGSSFVASEPVCQQAAPKVRQRLGCS